MKKNNNDEMMYWNIEWKKNYYDKIMYYVLFPYVY